MSEMLSVGVYSQHKQTSSIQDARFEEISDRYSSRSGTLYVQASSNELPLEWYKIQVSIPETLVYSYWLSGESKGQTVTVLDGNPNSGVFLRNQLYLFRGDLNHKQLVLAQLSANRPFVLKQSALTYPKKFIKRARKWWGYPLAIMLLPPALVLDIINIPTGGVLYGKLCCGHGPPDFGSCQRCNYSMD